MNTQIELIEGIKEETLPLIKLTKSKTGKTGTATFLFVQPTSFCKHAYKLITIDGIYLLWDDKKIVSRDLKILFKDGKPFLIRSIFIFKNSKDWFTFLNFMNIYSRETGLLFSETSPNL